MTSLWETLSFGALNRHCISFADSCALMCLLVATMSESGPGTLKERTAPEVWLVHGLAHQFHL